MAISNVSVYTRTTENGKRRYEQADHRTSYPDGTIFCLRYEVNGRRKWETLTGEMITYKYALCRAKLREADLLTGAINTAKNAPVVPVVKEPVKPARLTIDQAIDRYLRNASAKSPRTYHGSTSTMKQFRQSCSKQFLDEINRQDLYDFVTFLRVQELGDRTCHNRVEEVVGLLRHFDIRDVTIRVRYTEKRISAYTREELRSLFAVCNPEDRLVFEFFLGSGCREGEVAHACWEDINFESKTYMVREHLELNFRPKDREEREIPLPDSLVASLRQRRQLQPDAKLIFPNKHGQPEGHFLRRLQDIVKKARLGGKWELHKFRKSFATMHHEAGVSARTLQKWLGHSSLETTLAYLEAADIRSERTREQVNNSFAVLSKEPATATCSKTEATFTGPAGRRGRHPAGVWAPLASGSKVGPIKTICFSDLRRMPPRTSVSGHPRFLGLDQDLSPGRARPATDARPEPVCSTVAITVVQACFSSMRAKPATRDASDRDALPVSSIPTRRVLTRE